MPAEAGVSGPGSRPPGVALSRAPDTQTPVAQGDRMSLNRSQCQWWCRVPDSGARITEAASSGRRVPGATMSIQRAARSPPGKRASPRGSPAMAAVGMTKRSAPRTRKTRSHLFTGVDVHRQKLRRITHSAMIFLRKSILPTGRSGARPRHCADAPQLTPTAPSPDNGGRCPRGRWGLPLSPVRMGVSDRGCAGSGRGRRTIWLHGESRKRHRPG
jgi:hypothetical protein